MAAQTIELSAFAEELKYKMLFKTLEKIIIYQNQIIQLYVCEGLQILLSKLW